MPASTIFKPRALHQLYAGGFLLINKPAGLTSFHACWRAFKQAIPNYKEFEDKGVGHSGTLDPAATGLLVCGFGCGRKLLGHIPADLREYEATVKLGVETNTGDAEGIPTERAPAGWTLEHDLQEVISRFVGYTEQVPPIFSSIRLGRARCYDLARKGLITRKDMPARQVFIDNIEYAYHPGKHEIYLKVACRKGTYIRSLGEDIARALGTVGHLTRIHRTRVDQFTLDDKEDVRVIPLSDVMQMLSRRIDIVPDLEAGEDIVRQMAYTGPDVSTLKKYDDSPPGFYSLMSKSCGTPLAFVEQMTHVKYGTKMWRTRFNVTPRLIRAKSEGSKSSPSEEPEPKPYVPRRRNLEWKPSQFNYAPHRNWRQREMKRSSVQYRR